MAQQLTKLCPNHDLQCYFFEPSAIAALSATSPTGFTVSGSWRQQFDWAVVEWNRDNVFEHPALRNLPDGDLSGVKLSYLETRTNCISLDSTWYATVDWPSLRIWADNGDGTDTIYYVPLTDHTTAGGSYSDATVQFELTGSLTAGDLIELAWLDKHYNYQVTGTDTLDTTVASLAAAINLDTGAGVTAAAEGAQITLTCAGALGGNANRIGVYGTVYGQGTEGWSPASALFTGGVSPATWQINLDFSSLQAYTTNDRSQWVSANLVPAPTTNIRKMRWTWAADIQPGEFQRTEFSVVVTNWTITGANLGCQVAGPGSYRIEDSDPQVRYQGSWAGGIGNPEAIANYSGGSIQWTTVPQSQIKCTYLAQLSHTLYLGTRRADSCGQVSVQVNSGAPQVIKLQLSGEDVLVRIPIAQFTAPGSYTVTITNTGTAGSYFYFDFLEIAVPSPNLPSFASNANLTLATDWDTLHSQTLAPERTAWLIYTLGFVGRCNHYAGALWFYELVQPGHEEGTVTITFSGTPVFSQYTSITIGGTLIQHQNLKGDTAQSITTCFAFLINQGSTAVWAQANGSQLTLTARAFGTQGNGITISVSTNGNQFTAETSGGTLAGGVDAPAEGPNQILWRTDLQATPRLNRAARDWSTSFFAALKGYGIDVTVSFSMELGNGDDSVTTGIAQRYPDGTAAWLNTPSLQTNFSQRARHSGSRSTRIWRT